MITLVKAGVDMTRSITCPFCGCEFSFLPGDVLHEAHAIYNVPLEFRKEFGGEYGPCDVKYVKCVPCPGCKLKVEIV